MSYTKEEKQIKKIIENNTSSEVPEKVIKFLYKNFDKYSWIGIYKLKNNDKLILGPWEGNQATEHTQIPVGKGICGSAAATGKTEVIPNVNEDNRYLSCFVSTKSEIVVPIKKNGNIIGEIDIDSNFKNAFDKKDINFLEKVADMLREHI